MDTLHISPLTLHALALSAASLSLAANGTRRTEPQVFDLATDLDELLLDEADNTTLTT